MATERVDRHLGLVWLWPAWISVDALRDCPDRVEDTALAAARKAGAVEPEVRRIRLREDGPPGIVSCDYIMAERRPAGGELSRAVDR